MQPYFLPYIGYFQLINAVDVFVVYDNIKYTKKGWINRNRYLHFDKDLFFTIPLRKDSDYLNIDQRFLADSFHKEKKKILNKLKEAYRKAPFFESIFPLVTEVFEYNNQGLFDFILRSIKSVCNCLDIKTEIIKSSSLKIDHSLKSEEKVIALCREINCSTYINPIGGVDLYSKNNFLEKGIALKFINSNKITYNQFTDNFIPWLSIIDVLMFNSNIDCQIYLSNKSYLIS